MSKFIPVIGWTVAAAACAGLALTAFAQTPEASPSKDVRLEHHRGPPAFADIDADKNGAISQAEFDAFNAAHKPPKDGAGPEGAPPGGPDKAGFGKAGPGKAGRHHDHRMGPPDFKTLDADKDGKITYAEFTAPMKARFDTLDADHDGTLSDSELRKPPAGSDGALADAPPPPPQ